MTERTTHSPNNLKNNLLSLPKKTTEPTPSQETGSSKQQPPSTSSAPKPQTTLSDIPPADNPLEEPNIWCEILKLEGHHHENKVAEGFQTWLKKTIDSSLFEVQRNMYLFLLIYILTSYFPFNPQTIFKCNRIN